MAFASHNLDYCIKCALFNSKRADIYTFFKKLDMILGEEQKGLLTN